MFTEFYRVTQTGTLAEYNNEFETMLNRVRGLPESTLLPIYVEGLQQLVKNQVRHQYPSSVASAMVLAVEFDSCLQKPTPSPGFQRRTWTPRGLGPPSSARRPPNQMLLATQNPHNSGPRHMLTSRFFGFQRKKGRADTEKLVLVLSGEIRAQSCVQQDIPSIHGGGRGF